MKQRQSISAPEGKVQRVEVTGDIYDSAGNIKAIVFLTMSFAKK